MASVLGITYGARSTFQSGNDYHQHSVHVSRRIAKLKKTLGIQVKDTKHYQDKDKTFEIDADKYESDPRYGMVLLLLAERDLAKALEITLVSEVSLSRSKEKFILSKLKRALVYLKQLIDISFNESNNSKKLELYVYHALVQGLLAVRQKKWTLAGYSLSIARNSLEFLESASEYHENKSSRLYRELIESHVDPSLQVAVRNSSFDKNTGNLNFLSKVIVKKYEGPDSPDDTYDELLELIRNTDSSFLDISSDEHSQAKKLIETVTWSSYTAKLHNSDIARLIMAVQANEAKINDKSVSSFDPVLLGWQEVLESHEADTERVSSVGTYEDSDESRDRQIVLTYIKYHLLFSKIRRDLALIGLLNDKKLKNSSSLIDINRDILRIYDIILTTVSELKDLPGVYSDQDLYTDIESLEVFFQSSKLYAISNIYEIVKKHKEALLILKTTHEKLAALPQLTTEFPGKDKILDNAKLANFVTEILDAKVKVHVLAQFKHELEQNQSQVSSVADAVNISMSVDTLHELKKPNKLVDMDSIQPVSVKPVFFDLAFNYIGEDENTIKERIREQKPSGRPELIETDDQEDTKPKKKGLFGLWR